MRLLVTTDTVGGVWTYAMELARSLRPAGVSLLLATMGASLSEAQRRQVACLDNVQVAESTYKLEWMCEPWEDVSRAGQWLLDLERQYRPDVIHLNGFAHGALPFRAPRLVAAHSCVISWWRAVKGSEAPTLWDRYRDAVAAGLRSAEMVVAPSCAMLEAVRIHYGPIERTRVIHNSRTPEGYSVATKEPFILCAGRLWDEAKNLAALDRVAPELLWPVLAAGDDRSPDGSVIRASSVRRLGPLDEMSMACWMSRAAIYALPARYEPFGLSVLEAALSGCALVLGDIASLREIWGDAAVFVPPDDDAALAGAIAGLINSPRRRDAMASAARLRACRYSPKVMADAYLDAYRQLIPKLSSSKEDVHPCASCSSTTRSFQTGITETPTSCAAS